MLIGGVAVTPLVIEPNERDRVRIVDHFAKDDKTECETFASLDGSPDAKSFNVAAVAWDGNGIEIVTKLRRLSPTLPIIATVGSMAVAGVAKAKSVGANECLLKPLAFDRLTEIVEHLAKPVVDSQLYLDLQKEMIGKSPAFLQTLRDLADVIPFEGELPSPILIVGENGTGKELLAKAIHRHGKNKQQPSFAVNVAAIPETLIESELFGHEKGAFTGATERKIGMFERCGGGTLFLDEFAEATGAVQVKLLRVLQERKFERVGGKESLDFKGRLVCATNRNVETMVDSGTFRQDLYFRVSTHIVHAAPLRERQGDVDLLAKHFLGKHGNSKPYKLEREATALLKEYPFPGNVRELENLMIHAIGKAPDGKIGFGQLPVDVMLRRIPSKKSSADANETRFEDSLFEVQYKEAMRSVEAAYGKIRLPEVLEKNQGNVAAAARELGIDEKTFRKKWREAGLPPLSGNE